LKDKKAEETAWSMAIELSWL